jgi:hypothetical protein
MRAIGAGSVRFVLAAASIACLGLPLGFALGLSPARATTSDTVAPLATFGAWSTYMRGNLCYAAAQPQASLPTNVRRDPVFFLVSYFPGKTAGEASTYIGYPFREDSAVGIDIASNHFEMYTVGDIGWLRSAADDEAIVNAMRRGATMVVKGTSRRGTDTTDTYSLSGFTAAVERAKDACNID